MAAAHTPKPHIGDGWDGHEEIARIREQRRYEIARDVLAGFGTMNKQEFAAIFDNYDDAARIAVAWADALLAELEK